MITYASLFSGIGGFDLGFDHAGLLCKAQVEFDEKASKVLEYHWPNVKRFKDVRNVGKHNLPAVDLICGGFPCQDVSMAGKRKGLDGERSGLWFEFHRIIKETKPRWVVIENVPGLLSSNSGRDFAVILSGLAECGYCVAYRILDSQYFGVAQRRRRVFIVASLGNGSSAEILFERTGGTGHIEPGNAARQAAATCVIRGAAIGHRPEADPQRNEVCQDTTFTLNSTEVHAVAMQAFRYVSFGEYTKSDYANCLKTRDNKDATDLISFMAGQGAKAGSIAASNTTSPTLKGVGSGTNQVPSVAYGIRTDTTPKWAEDKALTLLTLSPSGGGHPSEVMTPTLDVRRLTPTECERLQGFPDGWTAVHNQEDSTRYKQLGNAITVNVAEWLGQRIMQSEWNSLCGLRESA